MCSRSCMLGGGWVYSCTVPQCALAGLCAHCSFSNLYIIALEHGATPLTQYSKCCPRQQPCTPQPVQYHDFHRHLCTYIDAVQWALCHNLCPCHMSHQVYLCWTMGVQSAGSSSRRVGGKVALQQRRLHPPWNTRCGKMPQLLCWCRLM